MNQKEDFYKHFMKKLDLLIVDIVFQKSENNLHLQIKRKFD